MKIAFVGKGGSGKTTLASLTAAHLSHHGYPVLAIDADINQHMAGALGATEGEAEQLPSLSDHFDLVKDHLRGTNERIPSLDAMLKTTPPGRGSRLLRVDGPNPVYDTCVRTVGGVRLAATGHLGADDVGVACYHGKLGPAELMLSHMIDEAGEYVIVDMTAGADTVASGLFARFDLVVLACEPTQRSLGVFHQISPHLADFGVPLVVVGNKVQDDADLAFLREQLGDSLLTHLSASAHVRASERGDHRPIAELEPANQDALETIRKAADEVPRDRAAYQSRIVELHLRNAAAWGNERAGRDLSDQVDPDYVPTGSLSPT
jgi:CO dehydrogenase maturation factor